MAKSTTDLLSSAFVISKTEKPLNPNSRPTVGVFGVTVSVQLSLNLKKPSEPYRGPSNMRYPIKPYHTRQLTEAEVQTKNLNRTQ